MWRTKLFDTSIRKDVIIGSDSVGGGVVTASVHDVELRRRASDFDDAGAVGDDDENNRHINEKNLYSSFLDEKTASEQTTKKYSSLMDEKAFPMDVQKEYEAVSTIRNSVLALDLFSMVTALFVPLSLIGALVAYYLC